MKPVLILYATREGHTRHIAEHICDMLTAQQCVCKVGDAAQMPEGFSLASYSAAIVCASLHMLKYEREMVRFVKSRLVDLQSIPAVFVSVSLAERTVEDETAPAEKRAEARAGIQRTIDEFLAETGWRPSRVVAVAGALQYSKYDFVTRFIMKRISKAEGGPVDTSHDYEFTDWVKLDAFVEKFVSEIK